MEKKFSELANFQKKQKLAEKVLFSKDCKYLLYGGAVGGGKSYWLRWSALELALYYHAKYNIEGVAIGLFSEDYPTLKDRQISKIAIEFPQWLGELKNSQTDGLAFHLKKEFGKGKILLRNLDDPAKYASSEFAAIGVEELTKNNKDTFDSLRHRLRYPGIKDTKFFAATNPGGAGHSFCKSFWITRDSGDPEEHLFHYIPASYRDNRYIDTESYELQLMGLPEELRKALMEGDWDLIAGQAFSELRRDKHLIKPFKLPPNTRYFAGFDSGFNHPFGFVLFAVVPTGEVYLTKHLKQRLKRPDEVAKLILELTKKERKHATLRIYCGVDIWARGRDGAPTIAEQLGKFGLSKSNNVVLAKAVTDRANGVAEIRKYISEIDGNIQLKFFENTVPVYDNLTEMQFDPKRPEDVIKIDADIEGNGGDDLYDSTRYALISRARAGKVLENKSSQQELMDKIHKSNIKRKMSQW